MIAEKYIEYVQEVEEMLDAEETPKVWDSPKVPEEFEDEVDDSVRET